MNRYRNGFTLVEVTVSLGLFILLSAAVVQIFITSSDSSRIVFDQLEAQSQGRKAVQDFTREIRSASYSSIGAYPLQKASSTEVLFYSNIDEDSYVEQVRYFLFGTKLVKGVTKPTGSPLAYSGAETTSTVAVSVNNNGIPLFSYFDQNYTGSGSPLSQPVVITDVKMVGIKLRLDKNPLNSPNAILMEGTAELRGIVSK